MESALINATLLVVVAGCLNVVTSWLAFKDLQELTTVNHAGAQAVRLTEENGVPVTTGSSEASFNMLHPDSAVSSNGPASGYSFESLHTISINSKVDGGGAQVSGRGERRYRALVA